MISRVISTLSEVRFRDADFRHVSWLVVLTFHLLIYWWFGWRYRDLVFNVRTYFAQMLADTSTPIHGYGADAAKAAG